VRHFNAGEFDAALAGLTQMESDGFKVLEELERLALAGKQDASYLKN